MTPSFSTFCSMRNAALLISGVANAQGVVGQDDIGVQHQRGREAEPRGRGRGVSPVAMRRSVVGLPLSCAGGRSAQAKERQNCQCMKLITAAAGEFRRGRTPGTPGQHGGRTSEARSAFWRAI